MRQILGISIVRFNNNNNQHQTLCCFDINTDTPLEAIKDALIGHLEDNKDGIVNASLDHYEEGEKDSFEEERQVTYDSVVSAIKAAKSLEDLYGYWELEDGLDCDTSEQILSHITIDTIELKQVT